MIVLVLFEEKNPYTGKMETLVSHGVDTSTLKNVQLPSVSPREMGYYNEIMGEWILNEELEEEE